MYPLPEIRNNCYIGETSMTNERETVVIENKLFLFSENIGGITVMQTTELNIIDRDGVPHRTETYFDRDEIKSIFSQLEKSQDSQSKEEEFHFN